MEENRKKRAEMEALIRTLDEAARVYYQEDREVMSNLEYDRLYDQLEALEKETGTVLSGSPTLRVGYEILSGLPEEPHAAPMLSLDKTKDPEALSRWLGDRKGILSLKLDGLTIVLHYRDGKLEKAVTRGNGESGEVITGNARVFDNLPLAIGFKGNLILRGEAVIRYSDFMKINETLPEGTEKYKNPRNLCSGSVRQLNTRITASRRVRFYGFSVAAADPSPFGEEEENSRMGQLRWLEKQGFETAESVLTDAAGVEEAVESFARQTAEGKRDLPSDGLVLAFDDIAYGRSLGATAKFPRDSIAFKWKDEEQETTLEEILWSPSRTGLINPIALFSPVELEGTRVSRASLHNLSILKELELAPGDRITVYKANMIIPQIAENLTRSGPAPVPGRCPACGGPAEVRSENGTETLVCPRQDCPAKNIKSLTHFVSRSALNIEGLSEATLEKLADRGFLRERAALFHLAEHREAIVSMDGFGEKSFANLIQAVESARNTTLPRFLYSLGIPGVGASTARLICRAAGMDWDRMQNLTREELTAIDGVGPVLAENVASFFENPEKRADAVRIRSELVLPPGEDRGGRETDTETRGGTDEEDGGGKDRLKGKNIVVTGSLEQFANREELKAFIEDRGGKVSGSVSGKTDFLISNDPFSASSKNRTASALGVPVITEREFMERYGKE